MNVSNIELFLEQCKVCQVTFILNLLDWEILHVNHSFLVCFERLLCLLRAEDGTLFKPMHAVVAHLKFL